ncbi:hypothetical protein BDW02DRAFT_571290 [Decorospora gaudefroyi]|uniref:Hyaluronan/mRNA-binding protein domain-containing protein n=1 Tax=Decorospora gaudefroyi TaxID=184978 RepID=A0A6A5K6Q3_9PLEO|nr:hypothetical protein BDW02DRAFT_571290 [Decorospora gaudefroyi]
MSQIASKNIYELLGNDPELDPDRPADPPTRAIEKPVMRHGKREGTDAPKPMPERLGNQNRAKQTDNANENAFRDRGLGSDKNRGRGSGEPAGTGGRGNQRGRGRGGRAGGRGGLARAEGDRHSRTGISEHEKQAAHGWGGNDGDAELADEQAGEAIAQAEEKDTVKEDAEAENNPEPEPEDRSKSYAAYLAEQAEKKLSLAAQNVRKANEGTSTKFPEGTALSREEQEDFMAGSGGKAKRERARKEKVHVELDGDRMLAPPPREGGGRGRGRGRGEFRGGEGRGRGEGRGEYRGRGRGGEGRGRGEGRGEGRGRGGPRGGGAQSGPNITDSSAFPSLGA